MYIFTYTVDWRFEDNPVESDEGIILANSYSDAAGKIECYYADDLVAITSLKLELDGDYIIPLTDIKNLFERGD